MVKFGYSDGLLLNGKPGLEVSRLLLEVNYSYSGSMGELEIMASFVVCRIAFANEYRCPLPSNGIAFGCALLSSASVLK